MKGGVLQMQTWADGGGRGAAAHSPSPPLGWRGPGKGSSGWGSSCHEAPSRGPPQAAQPGAPSTPSARTWGSACASPHPDGQSTRTGPVRGRWAGSSASWVSSAFCTALIPSIKGDPGLPQLRGCWASKTPLERMSWAGGWQTGPPSGGNLGQCLELWLPPSLPTSASI